MEEGAVGGGTSFSLVRYNNPVLIDKVREFLVVKIIYVGKF